MSALDNGAFNKSYLHFTQACITKAGDSKEPVLARSSLQNFTFKYSISLKTWALGGFQWPFFNPKHIFSHSLLQIQVYRRAWHTDEEVTYGGLELCVAASLMPAVIVSVDTSITTFCNIYVKLFLQFYTSGFYILAQARKKNPTISLHPWNQHSRNKPCNSTLSEWNVTWRTLSASKSTEDTTQMRVVLAAWCMCLLSTN